MEVHGWTLYFHGCFEEQLTGLLEDVHEAARRRPDDYRKTNVFKRLAAVASVAFDRIPRDPANPRYRQGETLGKDRKHWFRAKFFQQYRLFFRFSDAERAIVYAWVNDEDSRRAYGSKTDAYSTFARMLANGHPPDDWKALKVAVIEERRLDALAAQVDALQRGR